MNCRRNQPWSSYWVGPRCRFAKASGAAPVFEVVADNVPRSAWRRLLAVGMDMSVWGALPELARLVDRTEGWPECSGYLAVLAHELRGTGVIDDFSGDQRFLVDYLTEEMLDTVNENTASFMMDASCLDRVSGDLCDAVLQRQGSASARRPPPALAAGDRARRPTPVVPLPPSPRRVPPIQIVAP